MRISVTDRCNLRCPYCLPNELFDSGFTFLPHSEVLSFEEITRLTRSFIDLGVEKLRITGGEPLLRRDLPKLLAMLRALSPEIDIALTTNGIRLQKMLPDLVQAGINRVNISLDAVNPAVAQVMAGREHDPEAVWQAALAAREAGLGLKMNMVVKRGVNEGEVQPLAKRCREAGITLRFIEFMDVGTKNQWNREHVVTGREIFEMLGGEGTIETLQPKYIGEVARRYRYRDGSAELGFINSISAPFCGTCNRARISADGTFYTCLFASQGVSLRDWLRTDGVDDTEIKKRLAGHWAIRDDRYSEIRGKEGSATPKPEMWAIGG